MDLDKKDSNYWISKEEWDKLNAFQEIQHKKFCKKYKKQIRRYLKKLADEYN